MPRLSRVKSSTGIYHVMLRGIDKREIFLSDGDYEVFLNYIKKAKLKSKFFLLSYCLMPNHVHLLIMKGEEEIGDIIRRITTGYVQYHNLNHGRTGHLFQNRFRSEPVDDEIYLLVVLRYIHQNPLKAGIVNNVSGYRWSSYTDYVSNKKTIIDADILLGYFSSMQEFIRYNNEMIYENCMDDNPRKRYRDDEIKEIIDKIINIRNLNLLDKQSRNNAIKRIKTETGISNRQLERVLGIGRRIIQKA